MNYSIVIHKDKNSDYGVIVPDLPGCYSAGRNLDEALHNAKEAIELHLEGLIEHGLSIPEPEDIEKHKRNRLYKGGTWAVVSVDESNLRIHAKRVNVTIPERVLQSIDRYADQHGQTRSGLLVRAITTYIAKNRKRKTG